MNPIQATDENHLILEDQFKGEVNAERPPLHSAHFVRPRDFWDKRYLCICGIHDQKFWRFDIFDLLTNESKSVYFKKSSEQFQNVMVFFLNYNFMLIVERVNQSGLHCVNLVKLNWEFGIFEKLEHFERRANFVFIIVDPLNQSKFVVLSLDNGEPTREYQECRLVNGKIKFVNVHRLFSGRYYQCSNDKLIGIDDLDQKVRIKTYNMIDMEEKSFETEAYSEHIELVRNSSSKWIVNCLYAAIRFQDSGRYGLMWADEKTRRWTILDFSINMRIQRLHFFDGSLIIYTKQAGTENGIFESRMKFYELAIHRPQPLRQKAWLRVIRNLEAEGHPNPYKEARRYLPFNTDLRPHWFHDVEKVEEEAALDQDEDGKKSNSNETISESEARQDSEKSDGDEEVPSKRFKSN